MNKLYGIILTFLVVSSLFLGGCTSGLIAPVFSTVAEPTAVPEEVAPVPAPSPMVSAEAKVMPAQTVSLSFNSAGLVDEVLASRGDTVEAGAVLARLDNRAELAAAITAAQFELVTAEQALADLYERAALVSVQYVKAIADTRDAVRDAQSRLDSLNQPSKQADIDSAYAAMILARDKLDKAKDQFEPYEKKSEDNVVRAALLNKKAQAEKDYEALERRYNNLRGVANEIDLAQAQANLSLAEVQLEDARREYEKWRDGPDPDEIRLAQARLTNAQAQLVAGQDALDKQELRAPFSGTIVEFNLKVGEFVTPGVPLVVIADLAAWQVETTDLTETDVALLAPGMVATIRLDAFPDQEFTGTIAEIGQISAERRGNITYPVILDFEPGETPVRWGMTAFVEINLEQGR